jgi:hypothetical protein
MDGGWWSSHSDIDRRLFVNEIHSQINNAGTKPEWWFKHEGSSQPHRISIGSADFGTGDEQK